MNEIKKMKLMKALGPDTVKELEDMSEKELKERVIVAEQAIRVAVNELEANEKYIEIKEMKLAAEASMKDLKKRQNAIIQFSLMQLADD